MARLDTDWAIAEIHTFLHITALVHPNTALGVTFCGTVMRGAKTEAAQRAHVVEPILDRVLPGWANERPANDKEHTWLRGQASRAKAALEREAELAQKRGDNAPDVDASNLHPWA